MTEVLVVYATREGQTEKVATQITKHLRKSGVNVQLVNARDSIAIDNVDLTLFDLLVFGASMHAGGIERELIDFIGKNVEQIKCKPTSFFLVLLSAATKEPTLRADWLSDARRKVDEQLPIKFTKVEFIAGALKYSQYPLLLKWTMKQIAKKAGEGTDTSQDYEYTDWKQVKRYAQKLVKGLQIPGNLE